jgi:hypothetical protein
MADQPASKAPVPATTTAASGVLERLPIVHIQPPNTLSAGLASEIVQAAWTEEQRIARTCQYCKRAYTEGGYAWRCEHYHEGLT